MIKKLIGLMITLTFILSFCAYGSQPASDQKNEGETAVETEMKEETENTGEVTQEQIEENIVGTWIVAEYDNHPALTNDKAVFNFGSNNDVYVSASLNSRPGRTPWLELLEAEADIEGNKVTLLFHDDEYTTVIRECIINAINPDELTANVKSTYIVDDVEKMTREQTVCLVKVNDDYSNDILGTWEGHCTSEGSVFDDGKDHRWEYKDEGTYVYYVKDGDNWVLSDDEHNEYFVAGNLLCMRWMENSQENREWWEITIDEDTMNWTALREDEDGKTYTATFEMKKVAE